MILHSRGVLAVGVLALSVVNACGSSSPATPTRAADITITAADGSATSLSRLGGEPLVVNLWATWCVPCLKEMPALNEVAGSQHGVRIVGVNVGDTAAQAAAFAAKLGVTYPQYIDANGDLETALGVTGLPATAFLSSSGTVLEVHQGAFTAATLRAAIAGHYPTLTQGSQP